MAQLPGQSRKTQDTQQAVPNAFTSRDIAAKVAQLQTKVFDLLARLPEHARTESWEHSWSSIEGKKTS